MPEREFAFVVDVKTKPGMEREYERLMLDVVERQTAEPTFVGTSVHRDPEDATHFVLYEVWRDRENFETVEMKKPYRRTYEESLERLLARPRETTCLAPTWSQGRLPAGASPEQARTQVGDDSFTTPASDDVTKAGRAVPPEP